MFLNAMLIKINNFKQMAEIHEIIEKWKVNKGLLAIKMDMPLGTFCNKLSPRHNTRFTDKELIRLKLILKEMGVELTDACDIDFNDALKTIAT